MQKEYEVLEDYRLIEYYQDTEIDFYEDKNTSVIDDCRELLTFENNIFMGE